MNETKQIFNERERERERERETKNSILLEMIHDWNLNYFMFYTTAT
jgi:hypothetical protein